MGRIIPYSVSLSKKGKSDVAFLHDGKVGERGDDAGSPGGIFGFVEFGQYFGENLDSGTTLRATGFPSNKVNCFHIVIKVDFFRTVEVISLDIAGGSGIIRFEDPGDIQHLINGDKNGGEAFFGDLSGNSNDFINNIFINDPIIVGDQGGQSFFPGKEAGEI